MSLKKILSFFLILLVVIITVLALLAIWDIIDLQNITRKTFQSLFVIFLSSVVILFIFAVLMGKENKNNIGKE